MANQPSSRLSRKSSKAQNLCLQENRDSVNKKFDDSEGSSSCNARFLVSEPRSKMSSLPLSSIEKIAKTADHERAIVFFLFFARFEYALKEAGFASKRSDHAPEYRASHRGHARVRQSKDAEVNWTKYSEHCSALLMNNKQPRFQQAVEYLRKNPPKKQIVSGGVLDWADDSFTGAWGMDRVLTLVRRVRNNLFHGGKRLVGHPEEAVSRDIKLLNAALTVMEACLDWDTKVKSTFLKELDRS